MNPSLLLHKPQARSVYHAALLLHVHCGTTKVVLLVQEVRRDRSRGEMKLIRRSKKGYRGKKGSSAPLQSSGAVDGGAGSNSRQVAPEDVLQVETTTTGYASSRDEAFFEASPWLDSDCEDDFYSVNGDATPARTFSTAASNQATPVPPVGRQVLPTLGAILKAEPLKPTTTQMKLGDLLKVKQEAVDDADDLSRAGSSVGGDEAGRCCIPQFARVVSNKERRTGK